MEEGNALYKSGLFQEAVQAYTLALTKLANTEVLKHATLLCNRAAAHLRCPGADAASSCAEDAEAALVMLAELPQEDVRSLVQKAEWRLQRARELMDIRRLHAEAQALCQRDAAGALRRCDSAAKRAAAAGFQDSELAEMQYTSGLALCRMCCFADAIGCFERCLALSPDHAEAVARRAAAQRALRAAAPALPESKPESVCIPFSMESYTCQTRVDDISNVRKEPIGHDDELSEEPEEDPATVGEVRLVLHKVLESIGGRLWDASLLQASWLAEHRRKLPQATGAGLKLLEVGAGLGLLGLTAQKLLPEAQVVMTDYDPAVLAAIETNIAANFREDERKPTTGRLDFRDFTSAALEASGGEPPGGTLKELVETGQLGSFHLVLGSDVVYDSYHGRQLALVISAMLLPQRDHQGPAPCAVFLLPDSRPRLASFVQALPSAGLSCRIERLETQCAFFRRLRRYHPSLGEDNSYSLYFVERLNPTA